MSASGSEGSFSLDGMMQKMPKFFRMADDMNALTSYINDMRIMMIFLIVASAVGGVGYLILKYKKQSKQSSYRLANGTAADDEGDAERGWTRSLGAQAKNGQTGDKPKGDLNGDRTLNL